MSSLQFTVFLSLILCCLETGAGFAYGSGQPQYISGSASREGTEDEGDWTGHIDNKAYLRQYEERRRAASSTPPVIVIEKERYAPFGFRNCDRESIYVNSPNSTLIIRDGYRVNCYPHHVIVPVRPRPEPYIRKKGGKRVWSTGSMGEWQGN